MAANPIRRNYEYYLLRFSRSVDYPRRLEMGEYSDLAKGFQASDITIQACYIMMGCGGGLSGICYAWAHEITTDDTEERALVGGSMNEMAYVVQAWLRMYTLLLHSLRMLTYVQLSSFGNRSMLRNITRVSSRSAVFRQC